MTLSPAEQQVTFHWRGEDATLLASGAFAVSLIYVNYAYSGWNAATYISGELAAPQRSLPWVLGISTTLVAALYCLLNFVFLSVAPIDAMVGKVEVGVIAANFAFGSSLGTFMGLLLALLLISTVSAMILAGPRVLHRIGQDYPRFAALARENADGIPVTAIALQSATALVFLWSASFEQILIFSGATMALNTFATVLGLFVLRWRRPDIERPFKVTLYPVTPLIFLIITGWMFRWLNPTILIMYPILLILYYRLARREEQQVLKEYGEAYIRYKETTPMFFPIKIYSKRRKTNFRKENR